MVFFPVEFKGISEEYRAYITHLIIINICIISKQKLLLIFSTWSSIHELHMTIGWSLTKLQRLALAIGNHRRRPSYNLVFVCRSHYIDFLIKELGIDNLLGQPTYSPTTLTRSLKIDVERVLIDPVSFFNSNLYERPHTLHPFGKSREGTAYPFRTLRIHTCWLVSVGYGYGI
jgi:hypothetical protein